MKVKENLTVREAVEYAKENGYNKEMFNMKIDGVCTASGRFIDAYYEII